MSISLTKIGAFETNIFDESAAEIVAFDPGKNRAFVVNGFEGRIDVLDISDPTTPVQDANLPFIPFPAAFSGRSPTSVAVFDGLVAVALPNDPETDLGDVLFFDTAGVFLGSQQVGALPDMLTFALDGSKVLTANEGQPSDTTDPDGSVSIISLGTAGSLADKVAGATTQTAGFTGFNGQEDALRSEGVRIFPGKTVSEDVEPEYIAVSPDGSEAFIVLQENNAVAVLDIATATIADILPLGAKDHSLAGNGLDPSDRDDASNAGSVPSTVFTRSLTRASSSRASPSLAVM